MALTTYILNPIVPELYLRYIQVSEVALVGFFAIYTISEISYSLSIGYSEQTAKSIRSLIRIAGAIIVIAVTISYLSQDPVIAASISTISGLVIGFAASNLIGNIIAGVYLAITRPFRIGDRIKVFSGDGRVSDIGLLYTRLLLDNGDEMLASNSSMVTTNIILRKNEEKEKEICRPCHKWFKWQYTSSHFRGRVEGNELRSRLTWIADVISWAGLDNYTEVKRLAEEREI